MEKDLSDSNDRVQEKPPKDPPVAPEDSTGNSAPKKGTKRGSKSLGDGSAPPPEKRSIGRPRKKVKANSPKSDENVSSSVALADADGLGSDSADGTLSYLLTSLYCIYEGDQTSLPAHFVTILNTVSIITCAVKLLRFEWN